MRAAAAASTEERPLGAYDALSCQLCPSRRRQWLSSNQAQRLRLRNRSKPTSPNRLPLVAALPNLYRNQWPHDGTDARMTPQTMLRQGTSLNTTPHPSAPPGPPSPQPVSAPPDLVVPYNAPSASMMSAVLSGSAPLRALWKFSSNL